jgi:hypothetical protein
MTARSNGGKIVRHAVPVVVCGSGCYGPEVFEGIWPATARVSFSSAQY